MQASDRLLHDSNGKILNYNDIEQYIDNFDNDEHREMLKEQIQKSFFYESSPHQYLLKRFDTLSIEKIADLSEDIKQALETLHSKNTQINEDALTISVRPAVSQSIHSAASSSNRYSFFSSRPAAAVSSDEESITTERTPLSQTDDSPPSDDDDTPSCNGCHLS